MPDSREKRLLYIALLGGAAAFPLAINPHYGGLFSLMGVACVAVFIASDRRRNASVGTGFPVILNTPREGTADDAKAADDSGASQ